MFAASKSGSVDAKDPQFNYVTMLLHGNGTNGAQNNTFVDSSTNNFTITRNGNTTQGTFTPYGSNWANYFPTISTDYLRVADNAAWDLGSNDFTIECWAFGINSTTNQSLLSQWVTANDANSSWQLMFSSGGGLYPQAAVNNGSVNSITSSTALSLNVWNHIAMTKSSTTFSLFLNGTRVATTTVSGSVISSSNAVGIGVRGGSNDYGFSGYISNARIVNGTAVYDATQSTITVPTTPLTAVTNTKLLTCQSNRFIDNSSNAFALTVTGSPSVQRFSPFSPTTAYSTSVIGGSGYFDGSGDYLTVPQNAAFNFGTGAFTVEAFVYLTAYPSGGKSVIFSLGNGADVSPATYTGWALTVTSTQITFYRYDGTETEYVASAVIPLNAWSHVVAVRNGSSNFAIYLNGTRVLSTTTSLSYNNVNTNNLNISYWTSGGGTARYITGYISNGRIVAGTAVYDPTSSTLTVPTAPLTAISGTSLLMNYTNAGILDNAMMNDLETVGNAQISTSVKKYGTGSIYLDGTGDAVLALSNPQGDFGSGNFTLEGWFYQTATTNQGYFSKRANTSSYSPFLVQYDSNQLTAYLSTSGSSWAVAINASTNPSTNTWNHVAFVRNGSTATLYLNGTSVGSASITGSLMTNSTPVVIGAEASNASNVFNGYIDDLRITKGVARYTANFTAPTAAFPDKG